MRIVSLLPSATEILYALGLGEALVGVSHECNFPPEASGKRVVIRSRIPHSIPPGEIDREVREHVTRGESLYAVDAAVLEELAPDLIVTQDLCHVCAASPDDLAAALGRFAKRPEVLCLNPHDMGDVLKDILRAGEATQTADRAGELVRALEARLSAAEAKAKDGVARPRVAFLEWLDPFYVGGHWVPEMIARAGGEDLFGRAGMPTFRVTPEEVMAAAPEMLLISPCGYDAGQARQEYLRTAFPGGWQEIPAVRDARVYVLEANNYYSRPGPRLVTGFEALVKLFHPSAAVSREAESIIQPIAVAAQPGRAASV